MNLEKYSIAVLKSLNLTVNEESYVTTENGTNITIGDVKVVIPIEKYIKDNVFINSNGKLEKKYVLFNPYTDDDIKTNDCLRVATNYMSAVSSSAVYGIFQQLITMLGDEEAQAKVHTSLQKWMVNVRNTLGNKVKLVDTKTYTSLNKLMEYQILNNERIVKYLLCRGETITGIKYSRVAKLDPKAYDALEETCTSLNIRKKDSDLFKLMFDFILPDIKDNVLGSKDLDYPSFLCVYGLFNQVQTRINFLLTELKDVLESPYTTLHVELVDENEVKKFKPTISLIPTTSNAVPVNTATANIPTNNAINLAPTKAPLDLNSYRQQIQQPQQQINPLVQKAQVTDGASLLMSRTSQNNQRSGFDNRHGSNVIMNNPTQGGGISLQSVRESMSLQQMSNYQNQNGLQQSNQGLNYGTTQNSNW